CYKVLQTHWYRLNCQSVVAAAGCVVDGTGPFLCRSGIETDMDPEILSAHLESSHQSHQVQSPHAETSVAPHGLLLMCKVSVRRTERLTTQQRRHVRDLRLGISG